MKIFYGISIFDKDKDLKGKEVAFEIEESEIGMCKCHFIILSHVS